MSHDFMPWDVAVKPDVPLNPASRVEHLAAGEKLISFICRRTLTGIEVFQSWRTDSNSASSSIHGKFVRPGHRTLDAVCANFGEPRLHFGYIGKSKGPAGVVEPRSEEHTSELQSHSDLVCRLLLEKKK